MNKFISNTKLFFVVIHNTIKYGLWKATLRKIFQQTLEDKVSPDVIQWYKDNAISIESFTSKYGIDIDENIISNQMIEIINEREANDTSEHNRNIKRNRMGGFANVPLIYSIVRDLKRKMCIECGVSMGASTFAILSALDFNQDGKLASNDLPYIWMKNPIEKIGILVPEDLKHRWKLFIGDDRDNLPKIFKEYKDIDFVHYDSNKSYEAREFFCKSIMKYLAEDSIVIFDDIIDNDHFYDLLKRLDNNWSSYVLYDGIKYVGVLLRASNTQ